MIDFSPQEWSVSSAESDEVVMLLLNIAGDAPVRCMDAYCRSHDRVRQLTVDDNKRIISSPRWISKASMQSGVMVLLGYSICACILPGDATRRGPGNPLTARQAVGCPHGQATSNLLSGKHCTTFVPVKVRDYATKLFFRQNSPGRPTR